MWVVQPEVEWPGEMRIFWGVVRGWKMGFVIVMDVDADISGLVGVAVVWCWWFWCGSGLGVPMWCGWGFYVLGWFDAVGMDM